SIAGVMIYCLARVANPKTESIPCLDRRCSMQWMQARHTCRHARGQTGYEDRTNEVDRLRENMVPERNCHTPSQGRSAFCEDVQWRREVAHWQTANDESDAAPSPKAAAFRCEAGTR